MSDYDFSRFADAACVDVTYWGLRYPNFVDLASIIKNNKRLDTICLGDNYITTEQTATLLATTLRNIPTLRIVFADRCHMGSVVSDIFIATLLRNNKTIENLIMYCNYIDTHTLDVETLGDALETSELQMLDISYSALSRDVQQRLHNTIRFTSTKIVGLPEIVRIPRRKLEAFFGHKFMRECGDDVRWRIAKFSEFIL